MYTVTTAQLPEPPQGADRIFIAPNAVIVLDGASPFAPDMPDASRYVDTLGQALQERLGHDPDADLRQALAAAIAESARQLDLRPKYGPSSTVAIARWTETYVDLLVLGDSQVSTPHGIIRDDRMEMIASAKRAAYRGRLLNGDGFDDIHRCLLADVQEEQALHRNAPDGYWIAEADPAAATYAVTRSYPTRTMASLSLATDGAYRPMQYLGLEISTPATCPQLQDILHACERWEAEDDPSGRLLPRSKRHDDKAIAALDRHN